MKTPRAVLRRLSLPLVVSFVLAVAACAAPEPVPTPGPPPTREPASVEAVDGRYRLVFGMPSSAWQAGESITGEARLELLEGDEVQIAGSSSPGVMTFEFDEVGGRRSVKPVWTSDCGTRHLLAAADSVILPLQPTGGGFSRDDPDREWYTDFATRSDVRLPVGQWDITAVASFNETWDCPPPGRAGVGLRATIRVTVVP